MTVRGLKENQIADELDNLARGRGIPELGIKDFVVKQVEEEWEIGFTFNKNTNYKLITKYGKVRKFLRLNGIEKWMRKTGVSSFSIYL